MATVNFAFGYAGDNVQGVQLPAMRAGNAVTESLTPTSSNQLTTNAAPTSGTGLICRVASDTAVYLAFGAAPDATNAATRMMLPAGGTDYFIMGQGQKAAVILLP